MPVDVVGDKDLVNVHYLVIKLKDESNLVFDTKRDLSDDFFDFNIKEIEDYSLFPNSYQLLIILQLQTINPEIKDRFNISDDKLQKIREQIVLNYNSEPSNDDLRKRIARTNLTYAGRLKLLNSQEDPLPKDRILTYKNVVDYDELIGPRTLERLVYLRLLAGENKDLWPNLLKKDDRRKIVRDTIERSPTLDFVNNPMWGRILLGNDFDMGLITNDRLKRWFDQMDKESMTSSSKRDFAVALKVLTAESVKIGNNGIEIKMPTSTTSSKEKPLPERRKY